MAFGEYFIKLFIIFTLYLYSIMIFRMLTENCDSPEPVFQEMLLAVRPRVHKPCKMYTFDTSKTPDPTKITKQFVKILLAEHKTTWDPQTSCRGGVGPSQGLLFIINYIYIPLFRKEVQGAYMVPFPSFNQSQLSC